MLYSTVGNADPFLCRKNISGTSTPLSELLGRIQEGRRSPITEVAEDLDELLDQFYSSSEEMKEKELDFDGLDSQISSNPSLSIKSPQPIFKPKPHDPYEIGKATIEVKHLFREQNEDELRQKKVMENMINENNQKHYKRKSKQRRRKSSAMMEKHFISNNNMKTNKDHAPPAPILQTGVSESDGNFSPSSKVSTSKVTEGGLSLEIEPSRNNPYLSDSLKGSFSHISAENNYGEYFISQSIILFRFYNILIPLIFFRYL